MVTKLLLFYSVLYSEKDIDEHHREYNKMAPEKKNIYLSVCFFSVRNNGNKKPNYLLL